jgi:glycine/D-amino acid oxidase-like deaminating enzyme
MGRVRAAHVILATNAYTSGLWPGLDRVFTPIRYFQFATAPLGNDLADILPGRQGVWDTARIMTSIRRDAQGRLVVGAMGRVLGSKTHGLSRRWAEKRLKTLFPKLGSVAFEEAWHGTIAMTPDHLPRICQLAPNLYAPIGYNGRGITTGTVLGAAVAELVSGGDRAELPLPIKQMSTVTTAPVMSRLYEGAFAAAQVWRSF